MLEQLIHRRKRRRRDRVLTGVEALPSNYDAGAGANALVPIIDDF
jgi:hypothetical protein